MRGSFHHLFRFASIALSLILAACSGGGGGGGSDGGNTDGLSLSTNVLTFTAPNTNSTPPSQIVTATVTGVSSGTLYIKIVSTGPAVASITNITITGTTTGQGTINPASASSLGPGVFTSTITIYACTTDPDCSSGQLAGSPKTINVTYTVPNADPRVNFVAPYIALSGESKPVIIRGSGFARFLMGSITPTVHFGGFAATNVSVTNDTEIRATPPALTAGHYAVSVSGVADIFVSRAALVVIDPPAFARTAISTGGIVSYRMFFDAERLSLLVANMTYGRIDRYAYQGGTTWTLTSGVAIPGFTDMALSPDGASLLALSGNTMWITDPAGNLSAGTTIYLSPNPNNPTTFRRVAFLNDGEAVIMGNTQWDNFAFYQILDGTSKSSVDLYGFPAGYLYTGNVWGAPDGSRTLVAEFGISSQRAYDINATDLKMGARPTVDPYRVVFSRNAMVAIVNGTLVIDGAYASLGSLPASDAQIVSWDGARAYTYTMATRKIRAFDLTSPNGTGGFTEITLGAGATLDATTEDPGGYIGTMEISPDGGTLFICGINRIVIISISSL